MFKLRSLPYIVATLSLLMATACGGDDQPPANDEQDAAVASDAAADATVAVDTAVDSGPADTKPVKPPVGELIHCAVGEDLPQGLVELKWDDGQAKSDVTQQSWTMLNKPVKDQKFYQAVRFDISQPVKIHGFRIQYGFLPAAGEVITGLYRDFGYNGFDFWAPDPIWTVKCEAAELKPTTWVTVKLPKPVKVDQPGLVFVGNLHEPGSAAWAFDGSLPEGCEDGNDCCGAFDACHSAWNFPELINWSSGNQKYFNWNGLSMTRPLDFMVRLVVEELEPLPADKTVLQPLGDTKPGHRFAWGDYDNDGWDDLFDSTNKLYRNDKGKLVDVSEQVGFKKLDVKGNGGVWGDFDNDGHLDLFVFWENNKGGDTLLRNKGDGTFEDVTKSAGLFDIQSYNTCNEPEDVKETNTPTPAAAWVDIDADGKLDLYLANFICWGIYTYYYDTVWHNLGGGKFENWTDSNGFMGSNGPALPGRGANPADADGDGDLDILVNNYVLQRNLYYRNNGDGTVKESALKTGLAGHPVTYGGNTRYGHSIGTAWGDLNRDGHLDVVVANLAHPRFWNFSNKTQILLNDGKGAWYDIQGDWGIPVGAAGLRFQETHSIPVLGDFDHDGHLDLAISATYSGRPSDFYWGLGDGTFELDVLHAGLTVRDGWGMALADIDHDGDLDLAAKGKVFTNTQQGRKPGHWVQVRVVGDEKANRAGLGTTVRVKAGDITWLRVVSGGNGQGCQDSQTQHVGLGDLKEIDSVQLIFPGGKKVDFKGPFKADQRLWLYESGKVHKGWAPAP